MKHFVVILALSTFGLAARAASLSCSGETFGYQFTVKAPVSGTHISGKISINVTNGSDFHQTGTFSATSSDIRAKQHLVFAGHSSDKKSTGSVSADYASGTSYTGTLSASAAQGSVDVPVNCTFKPARDFFEEEELAPVASERNLEFEALIESLIN